MTVIVGVLCQDGVVVGSDSSATFTATQFRTIEQPIQKTYVVEPDIVFAGTGQVGLGQRFGHILEQIRGHNSFENCGRFDIVKSISKTTCDDFRSTYVKPGGFGALVAFHCRDGFQLCEFATQDFQPELKTEDMWFVSMGSGQGITDPFLGLLRRVFFKSSRPTLSEGVFAVTWALDHAIELNTGGIGAPAQIGVLEISSTDGIAAGCLLDDEELAEHTNNVKAAEAYLEAYRDELSGRSKTTTTPPPAPPA